MVGWRDWWATDCEFICITASGRNAALGDSNGAVHSVGALLEKTMPMKTGRLVAQLVVDVDNDRVTNIGLERRTWPLPIDTDGWANMP